MKHQTEENIKNETQIEGSKSLFYSNSTVLKNELNLQNSHIIKMVCFISQLHHFFIF